MIVEQRQYRIVIGKMPEFIELYRKQGLPILIQHLWKPLGFFTVDIGDVGSFVHMWCYKDFSDREERRRALHNDDRWKSYVPLSQVFILQVDTRILNQLNFVD